jgi:glycosyltransferase involved in cell wall biosynthesis
MIVLPKRRYVFAQCSGRDRYQLPAALQEADMLEAFCTDFYLKDSFARWINSSAAKGRREVGGLLPDDKVLISWPTVFWQQVTSLLVKDKELRAYFPDSFLTRMVSRVAARRDAHIMTYEPWAVRRPAKGFPNGRLQILFHCHPHVEAEDRIYARDLEHYSEFYSDSHVTQSRWRQRTADAWRQADLVLCASSFTRDSLLAAGLPPGKCVVIPYGADSAEEMAESRDRQSGDGRRHSKAAGMRLLFVGRNPLRKGLHHLLLAWSKAQRRPEDLLTVVCKERPETLLALAESAGGVKWVDRVSGEELNRLYADSDALVVPSLCEGFGHVYLEAMSHGCPVVGTRHSVLPDIGGEERGVFLVDVGNAEQLAALISAASTTDSLFGSRRVAAAGQPKRFRWSSFRQGVTDALAALESGESGGQALANISEQR